MTPLKKTTITLLFCMMALSLGAQKTIDYHELNKKETRLLEFKDDNEMLETKLWQLQTINRSRAKHKVQPVALDILASRMANKMAHEAISGKFMGHFNLLGQWPWYRYALAGGLDHISENAAAMEGDAPFDNSMETKLKAMQDLHNAFMSEKKPNDGHKQNCIDKHHNFVGLGLAVKGGQLRYYEVYIDRYLDIRPPKTNLKPNEKWQLSVKPIDKSQNVWMCAITYEPFPKPMTAKAVSAISSYDDFGRKEVASLAPWELPQPDNNGYTNFEFSFKDKGLYYVQIYLNNKPYTHGEASTEGKIGASGVVVTVE